MMMMMLAIWITENTIKNIAIGNLNLLTLHSQDLLSYSPYYLSHNSYGVSLENLVLDQLKIH